MAMEELRDLFSNVKFDDYTQGLVKLMCDIIVDGRACGYVFTRDLEDSSTFYPQSEKEEYNLLILSGLPREILLRKKLIEIEQGSKDTIIIRPTEEALKFYERLRQENLLTEEGYLNVPEPPEQEVVED